MSKFFMVQADLSIEAMYGKKGWTQVVDIEDADIVQFTGGSDVDPVLYMEEKHYSTHSNPARDLYEAGVYNWCLNRGLKSMAGICRGAQFLNVMRGGSMHQDVDNHAIHGTHKMELSGGSWWNDNWGGGDVIDVTSTHHQMMIAPKNIGWNAILGEADEASTKLVGGEYLPSEEGDLEVAMYFDDISPPTLCFQAHPEYMDPNSECVEYYFYLLGRMLNIS